MAHSTETALLKVKNDIMTSIHNRHGVFLVLLDLSAAFDTVTHEILFDRMEHEIGITGSALNYLSHILLGEPRVFVSTAFNPISALWIMACHRDP